MALTQLDSVAALLVVDLQKGILGFPLAHPIAPIVERSAELAREFRKRGLPVVLINVAGRAPGRADHSFPKFEFPPDWAELAPELEQQPSDILITKYRVGAFLGTALQEELQKRGVTQVFLTGVATSAGVLGTMWSAFDYGYNVVTVVDAMTDRSMEAHEYCVGSLFPRFTETETAENVLGRLRG